MVDKAQFQSLIAGMNAEYAESRERGTTWFPPPGEYLCSVKSLDRDIQKQQDGKTVPTWRFNLTILTEGEYQNREFPLDFRANEISFGMLKAFVRTMTQADPPANIPETDATLDGFVGEAIGVRCRKNPKTDYTNVDVLEHYPASEG